MLFITLTFGQAVVVLGILFAVAVWMAFAFLMRRRASDHTLQLDLEQEYHLRVNRTVASVRRNVTPPVRQTPPISKEKLEENLAALRRSRGDKAVKLEPTFVSSPPTMTGPRNNPMPEVPKRSPVEPASGITDSSASDAQRITVEKPVVFEELQEHRSQQQSLLVNEPPSVSPPVVKPPPPQAAPPRPITQPDMRLKVPRPQPHADSLLEIPQTNPAASTEIISIIDVTGQSVKIPASELSNGLVKVPDGVPYWEHRYIYSASELEHATQAQKQFYTNFRLAFQREIHYDLEGNSNYAFILLFDLAGSYNFPADLPRIERQLDRLAEYFPKTRSYIRGAVYDRMLEISDHIGIAKYRPAYDYRSNWEDQWLLGNRHKKRLSLSPEEVKLLNRLPYQRNNFLDIQFCGDQVMRLFLRVAAKVESHFAQGGVEYPKELAEVYDVVARKHFRYRNGSANYQETVESGERDFLDIVFRYCDNTVREDFGHKRKRSHDLYYLGEAKSAIEDRLIARVLPLITEELGSVKSPDRETELRLNAANPTRWKTKLDQLKDLPSTTDFVDQVIELEKLNEQNPSKENIYFEASKFIAKTDKTAALELFVRYVDCDLRSQKFDNKKLTKTVQKSLFSNEQQISAFEVIIGNLIKTRDLNAALVAVSELYVQKRKRIRLSSDAIRDVRAKHSDTVELLNEYLQDEGEHDREEIRPTEIELKIPGVTDNPAVPARSAAAELVAEQHDLLELFERSDFLLGHVEVEAFAAQRGLFKNQLVESINEACYELLDDVLIEEEEDSYTVYEDYFRKVFPE